MSSTHIDLYFSQHSFCQMYIKHVDKWREPIKPQFMITLWNSTSAPLSILRTATY